MSKDTGQNQLGDFAEIIKRNEPLAPYTYLKVGGPAEMLIQPRSVEELKAVVSECLNKRIALRVLGSGCSILIRDEGVRGAVLRLSEPAFSRMVVDGARMRCGTGTALSALISEAARNGLAGLEPLVGIPGTVGGALRCNAGDRSGEIGQFVRAVEVLDDRGEVQLRERDELRFAYRWSNLDEPVLLSAEFELERDRPDAIVKRVRKTWIQRKASQPLSFQPSSRLFKNPRGMNADTLIAQAGLVGTRVGSVEVSERNPNFIVADPGATARDVLRLVELIQSKVREHAAIDLELEITIW
jgi:UDP-N-acetylmuramate dehydrogenase